MEAGGKRRGRKIKNLSRSRLWEMHSDYIGVAHFLGMEMMVGNAAMLIRKARPSRKNRKSLQGAGCMQMV